MKYWLMVNFFEFHEWIYFSIVGTLGIALGYNVRKLIEFLDREAQ